MNEQEKKRDPVARVLFAIGRGALVLALFFYLLYHLTNGFATEMKTQTVRPDSEEVTLSGRGTVVRDEVIVNSSTSGVVSYLYDDGDKVKATSKLLMVYTGKSDSDTVARIAEIDKAIELLSSAQIDEKTTVSDGAAAEREISSLLMSISSRIGSGDYRDISSLADKLLSTSIRRDTILSDSEGAGATLAALNTERDALAQTLGGGTETVRASAAGYFYSYTDGGENTFDYDSILDLTAAEYRIKLDSIGTVTENAVGKIVRSPEWYLLLPVSPEEASKTEAGDDYDLLFEGDGVRLNMTLVAVNEGAEESLLIFKSNRMPNGFSFDREQNVSVVCETVNGYRLPASALRVVDGNLGVYIRSGNNIKFRAVELIYESGAYVFVRTDTEGITLYGGDDDETNDIYCKGLSLYDEVIISGAKDLSPDRIVN